MAHDQVWFLQLRAKETGRVSHPARVRADLDALKAAAGLEDEVVTPKSTDYRYRMVVDQAAVSKVMAVLGESIDYSNFKSHIAATHAQRAKLHAYHEVWGIMEQLQSKGKT